MHKRRWIKGLFDIIPKQKAYDYCVKVINRYTYGMI